MRNRKKVVQLRDRPVTVQNIIREVATNYIDYAQVMFVGRDKDDCIHMAYSRMRPSERAFLADMLKHQAMKDME